MKLPTLLASGLATLTAAQAPYTDAKSGITFNTYINPSTGYFFGLALPNDNATIGNTDFIATIGGKGTGYSGVSLGGGMVNKLLIAAWPNGQDVVSTFRETAKYGPPAVATGPFTQSPIANGTYVNSTHWTYTFLCSRCILSDGTTFAANDSVAVIGWASNGPAPGVKSNAAASLGRHTSQGIVGLDLGMAKSAKFAAWKSWAKVSSVFVA